jgi:hypothetical protein
VYLFGEGYGAGIQTGGGYRADKAFILFDVQVNGKFLSDILMREVATAFGLEVVPIVFAGQIGSAVMFVNAQKHTTIGLQKHPFEGAVGRLKNEMYDSWGNRLIIKIKKCDFE